MSCRRGRESKRYLEDKSGARGWRSPKEFPVTDYRVAYK